MSELHCLVLSGAVNSTTGNAIQSAQAVFSRARRGHLPLLGLALRPAGRSGCIEDFLGQDRIAGRVRFAINE